MVEVGDQVRVVVTGEVTTKYDSGSFEVNYTHDFYTSLDSGVTVDVIKAKLPTKPGSVIKNVSIFEHDVKPDIAVLDDKGRWWFSYEDSMVYVWAGGITYWEPFNEN